MYNVLAPERGVVLDVTVLDEMILGQWAHWKIDPIKKRGRSVGCLHFQGECPLCEEKVKRHWLGFVGVWNHAERRRDVLRLGPEGAKRVAMWASRVGGLRGVRLNIKPGPVGVIGGLEVMQAREEPLIPLIHPHKIIPTVMLILGMDSVDDSRVSAAEVIGPVESDEQGGVS